MVLPTDQRDKESGKVCCRGRAKNNILILKSDSSEKSADFSIFFNSLPFILIFSRFQVAIFSNFVIFCSQKMKLFFGYLQIFNNLTKLTTSINIDSLLESPSLSTTLTYAKNSSDIETKYRRKFIIDIIALCNLMSPIFDYNVKYRIQTDILLKQRFLTLKMLSNSSKGNNTIP